ncbi:DUF309 domain-containing protein [Solibacillus daqui]|uniref:DUF309 domain-containing protein n=1 Tax=Solibacillus daqui TaxID=2912187 RepID=UPI00236740E3|nr:DUF309 domain-containing protein [Solibacillus daqui]
MHPLFHPLFIEYCAYFNGNEDYFECHEVLEEYWKEVAPGEKLHSLVGYVQLATGMYHWRRENFNGADRIFQKAINNFKSNKNSPYFDYVYFEQLIEDMQLQHKRITAHEKFTRIKIPINHPELHIAVLDKIIATPTLDPHFLLNKHMLRDRSDIIALREANKLKNTNDKTSRNQ